MVAAAAMDSRAAASEAPVQQPLHLQAVHDQHTWQLFRPAARPHKSTAAAKQNCASARRGAWYGTQPAGPKTHPNMAAAAQLRPQTQLSPAAGPAAGPAGVTAAAARPSTIDSQYNPHRLRDRLRERR